MPVISPDSKIPVRRCPVAIIDFETTWEDNADRTQHPVSVAIVHAELGVSGSEKVVLNKLIDPEFHIREEATKIHGIDNFMVKGKPTIQQTLPEIEAAIDGRVLVAYNLPFDWGVLNAYGAGIAPFGTICGLVIAKVADQYKPSKKLVDVCKRRNVDIEGAHDASVDALATARVIPLLLRDLKGTKKYDPVALETIEGLWLWTCREALSWERWFERSCMERGKPKPDLSWTKLLNKYYGGN